MASKPANIFQQRHLVFLVILADTLKKSPKHSVFLCVLFIALSVELNDIVLAVSTF